MFAATFVLSGAITRVEGAPYEVKKLMSGKNGADYLVITSKTFLPAMEPLLEKRAADGLRVAVVTTQRIHKTYTHHATGTAAIQEFVRFAYYHWTEPHPKYLLLVGDTVATATYSPEDDTLPAFLLNTAIARTPTASDNHYADVDGDELPDMAVGRIPADTPEELEAVVKKILDYEAAPEPGPWRRRVSMFASEGHFSKAIDSMIEEMVKTLVRENVSPNFDLNMTYANPGMPYFYIPDKFGDKVVDRFNQGSLFMIYIGHGSWDSFDSVHWGEERYPIMSLEQVPLVEPGARKQFVFIIACLTGDFDRPEDSIAEMLLKSPTGPVGVFASSEISHPYSNAVLNKDIAYFLLTKRPETIGEALLNIKRSLIKRNDKSRQLIDKQTKLMLPQKELDIQNRDHLYLYNYFGDPATRIPYPDDQLEITAPAKAQPGDELDVTINTGGRSWDRLLVTLECPATEIIHKVVDIEGLEGDALNSAIESNYAAANNKVAVSGEQENVQGGMPIILIKVPDTLPAGEYYVKAYAWGGSPDAMGFTPIEIYK